MKKAIGFFLILLACSPAFAKTQVLTYPAKIPAWVCQPSDSDTNCGGIFTETDPLSLHLDPTGQSMVNTTLVTNLNADLLDGNHASAFVTSESDPIVGAINGIVKANGVGTIGAVISGTDIKTINSASLLGSGDIALQTPLSLVTNNAQPRVLANFYADVSSSSTNETDLYSYTLPANTLTADGQALRGYVIWCPTYGGVSHTSTPRLYFAGTNIVGTVFATSYNDIYSRKIEFEIIRTSSSTYRVYYIGFGVGSVNINQTSLVQDIAINWTVTNILKLTGQTTNATYPVKGQMMRVYWEPIAGG
jgi:hypothetical protein